MSHTVVSLVAKGEFAVTEAKTPSPKANEVLVRVRYALISAFDSHQIVDSFHVNYPQVLGVGVVGEAIEIGEGAEDAAAPGDKVFALAFPPGERATQEYAIVLKQFLAKLPSGVKPEAAVALPDNFVTAWWTISHSLGLPLPKSAEPGSNVIVDDPVTSEPILVWAAGTSAAQYIIQVLKLAGYKNIIATASKRSSAAASKSGATHVFDYSDPNAAEKIREAAGGKAIKYAVDPVGFSTSLKGISKVVEEGSKVAILLPVKVGNSVTVINSGEYDLVTELPSDLNPFKQGVEIAYVATFQYPSNTHLRDNLIPKILPGLLASGHITPTPVRVLDSGSLLDRVKEAATLIKNNALGGERAVVKIDP